MQTHHAVLAMWLIINQVEFESLQHTSACCTLEAIDVPDSIVNLKSITDNRQTASCADRTLNSVIMQLTIDIAVELIVRTVSEGHPAAGASEASFMPVPGSILVVEIHALGDRLVTASAHQG